MIIQNDYEVPLKPEGSVWIEIGVQRLNLSYEEAAKVYAALKSLRKSWKQADK